MKDAVAPLAEYKAFTDALLYFSKNPVLGILAGFAITGIVQSSSASMGMLIALASQGILPLSSALLDSGVHAAPAEDAADSQLPHGLYNAVVQPFPWMGIHIIHVGGDTAVDALHQAQHGAVVAVIGSQVGGCGEGHGFQPVL